MDLDKLKNQLRIEVGTAFLYDNIDAIQSNGNLSRVVLSLGHIEKGHTKHIFDKILTSQPNYKMPLPSGRAKFQLDLRKIFGYTSLISSLFNIEKQFAINAIKIYK